MKHSPSSKPGRGLQSLRVLIVEDSENAALLLLRELRKGGYEPEYVRVETTEAMEQALDASEWDVVISDYQMPRFGVLAVFKRSGLRDISLPRFVAGQDRVDHFLVARLPDHMRH